MTVILTHFSLWVHTHKHIQLQIHRYLSDTYQHILSLACMWGISVVRMKSKRRNHSSSTLLMIFFEMLFWPLFLFGRWLLIALPTLVGDLGPCIPTYIRRSRRRSRCVCQTSRRLSSYYIPKMWQFTCQKQTYQVVFGPCPVRSGPAWYRPIHAATYVCMSTSHLLAYNRTYTSINEYSPLVSFEPYSVFLLLIFVQTGSLLRNILILHNRHVIKCQNKKITTATTTTTTTPTIATTEVKSKTCLRVRLSYANACQQDSQWLPECLGINQKCSTRTGSYFPRPMYLKCSFFR